MTSTSATSDPRSPQPHSVSAQAMGSPSAPCPSRSVSLIPADEELTKDAIRLGYEDLSPSSTPDASEPEDEADEDSNDEDYYRNDYPEDEDADEDMRGYRDAFSDEDEEAGYGDDGDARGEWDYR